MHCDNFKEEVRETDRTTVCLFVFSESICSYAAKNQLPNIITIKVTLILVVPVLCGWFLQHFKQIGVCDFVY